jgi:hypothetical protein
MKRQQSFGAAAKQRVHICEEKSSSAEDPSRKPSFQHMEATISTELSEQYLIKNSQVVGLRSFPSKRGLLLEQPPTLSGYMDHRLNLGEIENLKSFNKDGKPASSQRSDGGNIPKTGRSNTSMNNHPIGGFTKMNPVMGRDLLDAVAEGDDSEEVDNEFTKEELDLSFGSEQSVFQVFRLDTSLYQ